MPTLLDQPDVHPIPAAPPGVRPRGAGGAGWLVAAGCAAGFLFGHRPAMLTALAAGAGLAYLGTRSLARTRAAIPATEPDRPKAELTEPAPESDPAGDGRAVLRRDGGRGPRGVGRLVPGERPARLGVP